jgi:hypothetical protein
MNAQLRPGGDLEELFHGSITTRHCDESVALSKVQIEMCHFRVSQNEQTRKNWRETFFSLSLQTALFRSTSLPFSTHHDIRKRSEKTNI